MRYVVAESNLSTKTPHPTAPRLYGARARAGMQALLERIQSHGAPARLFGHPALAPANRDGLVAGLVACFALMFGAIWPAVAIPAGLAAVFVCAAIGFSWFQPWPRQGAWTIIVGEPGPAVRKMVVLALDTREPRPWLSPLAGSTAALGILFPGWWGAAGLASIVAVAAAIDRARSREISLEQADEWVRSRPPASGSLVLVTTAGSGFCEGVQAVVDWYGLPGREITIEIDESHAGRAARRLSLLGIGRSDTKGGPDVVVGERARG